MDESAISGLREQIFANLALIFATVINPCGAPSAAGAKPEDHFAVVTQAASSDLGHDDGSVGIVAIVVYRDNIVMEGAAASSTVGALSALLWLTEGTIEQHSTRIKDTEEASKDHLCGGTVNVEFVQYGTKVFAPQRLQRPQ